MKILKKVFALLLVILIFSFGCDFSIFNTGQTITADLLNTITETTIRSTFKITNTCTKSSILETEKAVFQGSGTVFLVSDGTYYLITNNHVAVKPSGYTRQSITVTDYADTDYVATLLTNNPDYDLAVLSFSAEKGKYKAIPFASSDPENGDRVISVGTPNNQQNAITIGKVVGYKKVYLSGENVSSHINFDVIAHTAPIFSGSSGGILLNYSLYAVGVNYAGSTADNGEFVEAYSVPITKVRACLSALGYAK